MTDNAPTPEEVIARALSNPKSNPTRHSDAERVLAALKEAGFAIVKLPDEMTDRANVASALCDLPMWTEGDAWTCLVEAGLIEFEADGQKAYGQIPTHKAVDLAVVLLAAEKRALQDVAAADVAEGGSE